MRQKFADEATSLLEADPRTALVLADISVSAFEAAARAHPARVINVGIREQLMLGVAGGLAMTGLRPIVHTYASFLVERAYEQIKLDLNHQGLGAVLVSVGASYDASEAGRTHQSPGDVSLLDALGGWTIHTPGHVDEVGPLLTAAVASDEPVYIRLSEQGNGRARPGTELQVIRQGSRGLVVAVGPMLDTALQAVEGLDVSVAYTNTPRPFDIHGLRALGHTDVVLVEPYLAGTSTKILSEALQDVPHRLLSLGVVRPDLHRYGSPQDHARWHGLDPAGVRQSISEFLSLPS
jgi:transketolase